MVYDFFACLFHGLWLGAPQAVCIVICILSFFHNSRAWILFALALYNVFLWLSLYSKWTVKPLLVWKESPMWLVFTGIPGIGINMNPNFFKPFAWWLLHDVLNNIFCSLDSYNVHIKTITTQIRKYLPKKSCLSGWIVWCWYALFPEKVNFVTQNKVMGFFCRVSQQSSLFCIEFSLIVSWEHYRILDI